MWRQVGFWWLVFIAFFLIVVTLDMDIAMLSVQDLSCWQAWCLYISTLGAILAACGQLGGPWEQQEGHMEVRNQILVILN